MDLGRGDEEEEGDGETDKDGVRQAGGLGGARPVCKEDGLNTEKRKSGLSSGAGFQASQRCSGGTGAPRPPSQPQGGCYLGMVRPRATIPLSRRCRSSLSKVSRISRSTAVSGSSRGLRYDRSSRPESSELGDMVEESGGSLGAAGWISLQKKSDKL